MHADYRTLLVRYLLPQRRVAVWMAALLLTSIAFQAIGPQYLRRLIDAVSSDLPQSYLLLNAAIFLLIVVVGQLIHAWSAYVSAGVGWQATNALRGDLLLHCLRLDMDFYKDHAPGELIERVDGDVSLLGNFFSQFIVKIAGNLLLIVVILIFVFVADARVGVLLTFYFALAGWALLRVQGVAVPHFRASRAALAKLSSFWEETLTMLEDMRGVGGLRYVARRDNTTLATLFDRGRKAQVMFRTYVGAFAVVVSVGNALAFVAGAWLYSQGAMTMGTVYLLMYYTSLMAWTLGVITDQVNDFQQATTAVLRVRELTATQSALVDGERPFDLVAPPSLLFRNVTFGYSAETPVLRDVSFELAAGEVLGVVGRTGSGKTSLARLLFRFYDPTTGAIELDSIDLRQMQLESLRANVGFVTQDVQLFHATVRDNLTLFDSTIADADILRVVAEVGLTTWYEELAHGLDTLLAGSHALSAGEAQLLAFGRVLLKEPRLVILDEATSRLDPVTEGLVEQAMARLLQGRTALVIVHRVHTLTRADKILLLEQGRVVEYGERAALAEDATSHFAALLRRGSLAEEVTV